MRSVLGAMLLAFAASTASAGIIPGPYPPLGACVAVLGPCSFACDAGDAVQVVVLGPGAGLADCGGNGAGCGTQLACQATVCCSQFQESAGACKALSGAPVVACRSS
jgi:hypothetical protein